jgi:hypothetical protein
MQELGIDKKPIHRRFQKYNFQTVKNFTFSCKGPSSSINHNIQNRQILPFTPFSIIHLQKLTFYVQKLSFFDEK